MTQEQSLKEIIQLICGRHLGKAMVATENYLLSYPQSKENERFESIKESFRLMTDYWMKSFPDPDRKQVYQQLLQRLYVLTTNLIVRSHLVSNASVRSIYSRTRQARTDWSVAALRRDLENDVTEQALLDLEPAHTKRQKQQLLQERHQCFIRDLFDYIWTSRSWSEATANAFVDMLLSPTLDTIDQQVLVSAITLAAMNVSDYQKLRLLATVYCQSQDVHVAQRALIGWVLSMDSDLLSVYPEMQTMVNDVLADSNRRQEIKELQMQLIYCMKADEDTATIQNEIVPELIKNNNQFRITRNGLEEIEEESLDELLHPEASEERLERLEDTMRRMMDMQKAGSDVYFGGFSQMKRFPFFQDISNWFVPFYRQHPGLKQVWGEARHSRVLDGILSVAPFCDSDCYSFALAYSQVASRISPSMLEMMEHGEIHLIGDQLCAQDKVQPAYVRRMYLQNLYRFFKLNPQRHLFVQPFDHSEGQKHIVFMHQKVFCQTALATDFIEVATFLVKHRFYEGAALLLANVSEPFNERYYMTCAKVMTYAAIPGLTLSLRDCYCQALALNGDNVHALNGFARIAFQQGDYEKSLEAYEKLLAGMPNHRNYLINKAVCLMSLKQYEESLKILYKLNYEYPEDQSVKRILAWTLVGDGRKEQAAKIYEEMDDKQLQTDDYLNFGICRWLQGRISDAATLFRRYVANSPEDFHLEALFSGEEADLLQRNGISDSEIRLMTDWLSMPTDFTA